MLLMFGIGLVSIAVSLFWTHVSRVYSRGLKKNELKPNMFPSRCTSKTQIADAETNTSLSQNEKEMETLQGTVSNLVGGLEHFSFFHSVANTLW